MDSCLSSEHKWEMWHNQLRPGLELGSPHRFLITITVTQGTHSGVTVTRMESGNREN